MSALDELKEKAQAHSREAGWWGLMDVKDVIALVEKAEVEQAERDAEVWDERTTWASFETVGTGQAPTNPYRES